MPAPTVSVVIPTYNRTATLARAIRSVLSQTIDDLEVIVVDDASTVAIEPIIDSIDDGRIELMTHDVNRGGSAARNTGIERAEGEYVAFLDSDDEWHPEKLERQLEVLEGRSEEWVAVYCDVAVPSGPSLLARPVKWVERLLSESEHKEGGRELITDLLMMKLPVYAGSTLVVTRDVATGIGGFDERFPRHQDWEFLIHVLMEGKLAFVDEPLVTIHASGRPDPETVNEAKELLLSTFDDEIERAERDGHRVRNAQMAHLAKSYFREGTFARGAEIIWQHPPIRRNDRLELLRAACQGVLARLQ